MTNPPVPILTVSLALPPLFWNKYPKTTTTAWYASSPTHKHPLSVRHLGLGKSRVRRKRKLVWRLSWMLLMQCLAQVASLLPTNDMSDDLWSGVYTWGAVLENRFNWPCIGKVMRFKAKRQVNVVRTWSLKYLRGCTKGRGSTAFGKLFFEISSWITSWIT